MTSKEKVLARYGTDRVGTRQWGTWRDGESGVCVTLDGKDIGHGESDDAAYDDAASKLTPEPVEIGDSQVDVWTAETEDANEKERTLREAKVELHYVVMVNGEAVADSVGSPADAWQKYRDAFQDYLAAPPPGPPKSFEQLGMELVDAIVKSSKGHPDRSHSFKPAEGRGASISVSFATVAKELCKCGKPIRRYHQPGDLGGYDAIYHEDGTLYCFPDDPNNDDEATPQLATATELASFIEDAHNRVRTRIERQMLGLPAEVEVPERVVFSPLGLTGDCEGGACCYIDGQLDCCEKHQGQGMQMLYERTCAETIDSIRKYGFEVGAAGKGVDGETCYWYVGYNQQDRHSSPRVLDVRSPENTTVGHDKDLHQAVRKAVKIAEARGGTR